MEGGGFELRERLRYYLSLNSLPLHYHSGGCRLGAASSAAIKESNTLTYRIDCDLQPKLAVMVIGQPTSYTEFRFNTESSFCVKFFFVLVFLIFTYICIYKVFFIN